MIALFHVCVLKMHCMSVLYHRTQETTQCHDQLNPSNTEQRLSICILRTELQQTPLPTQITHHRFILVAE